MKNNLRFDFIIDKSAKTVFVKREFAADLSLVWMAFTKPEILDQWWAPKPWISKTKYMNFEIGGRRFYAMCSPDGLEHWSIQDFTSISPITNFKYISSFADKDENMNADIPGSEWNLDFSEEEGVTTVSISIINKTTAAMEQKLKGFQEGFTMALDELEKLLLNLKNK